MTDRTMETALETARHIVGRLNRDGGFAFGAIVPATQVDIVARALLSSTTARDEALEAAAKVAETFSKNHAIKTPLTKIRQGDLKAHVRVAGELIAEDIRSLKGGSQ